MGFLAKSRAVSAAFALMLLFGNGAGAQVTPAAGYTPPDGFRNKYAYAQFNLDDWMARGWWVRLGIQQTPWVDFEEGIDAGISFDNITTPETTAVSIHGLLNF